MNFHEEAFEAAAKITAAVAEEAEIELNEEGAQQAGDFFAALYRRLWAIANGEEEEKPAKPGSFEVYQDAAGEYRFRLKAANGQTIAVSEGYTTKDACLNGVESVKRSSNGAKVKQL